MSARLSLTRFHPADGPCSPVFLLHTRDGFQWHTVLRERGVVPTYAVFRGDFNDVAVFKRGQYGSLI